jgi:hypothetical protein
MIIQKYALVPIGGIYQGTNDRKFTELTNVFFDGERYFIREHNSGKLTREQVQEMAKARHDSMRENIGEIFGSCFSQAWNELDDDTIKLNIKDMTEAVKAIGLDVEDNDEETV